MQSFLRAAAGLAAVALLLPASASFAAQLRVEPVLLEITAPSASGTLTLFNADGNEVAVQTRVFRWSQRDGREYLDPTSDVVASPPTVKLGPRSDNIVRVVRVSKRPVAAEESYRVVIDQLPNLRQRQSRAVDILIRQSIPIFFRDTQVSPAKVSWSYRFDGAKLIVTAVNPGDERLRIASLRLSDPAGAQVFFGNGLVGYVLGRSTMSWIFPSPPSNFGAGGSVSVSAQSDKGPINAAALASGRQ